LAVVAVMCLLLSPSKPIRRDRYVSNARVAELPEIACDESHNIGQKNGPSGKGAGNQRLEKTLIFF